MLENRFETRPPSPQTIVDIFKGRWASDLAEVLPGVHSGGIPMFRHDERPRLAAAALGAEGRLDGMEILELGPLEGAHSFQLQALGARSVIGVEANAEAYLKCLIVKQLCALDAVRFLFGDLVRFLEENDTRFDLVFCSGVLYHMSDPLQLIREIARHTDRCFVWTHYFREQGRPVERTPRPVERHGFATTYHEAVYDGRENPNFWGGNTPTACWLERDAILGAFSHFGFGKLSVLREGPDDPAGPWISFAARK